MLHRVAVFVLVVALAPLTAAAPVARAQAPGAAGPTAPEARVANEAAGVLSFRSVGQGTPVLLLAGGPGLSSRYLDPVARRIAEAGYRAIVVDQRGTALDAAGAFAEAAPPPEAVTLDAFVADLDRLRTHLGLDGVVVFGHSWGGMLAMAYAAAHPSHVRALVLSGSGGVSLAFFGRYAHAMRTRLRPEDVRALAAWADSLAAGVDPARVARARRRIRAALYLHDRAHLPTLVAEALDPAPMNRTVFDGMMRDLHRRGYDLRPRLGAFEGPALVVQGRHDAVGLGTARRIARHLVGARLRLLDDCAHYPWIETPAVYYDAVLGFLHRVE